MGGAKSEKIFAVGDIHGCSKELEELLRKLPLTKLSTLLFVGDYVDRGEGSMEVIELILDYRKRYNVITLLGNHEVMFLDFLADPKSEAAARFIYNGGAATLASYGVSGTDWQGKIPTSHLEFLSSLRLTYETEKYFFVHAGVPDKPLNLIDTNEDRATCVWIRDPFLKSHFDWDKVIVHGHSPVENVSVKPNRINLDTGCCYNRWLSAIELPDQTVYTARRQVMPSREMVSAPATTREAQRFIGSVKVSIFKDEMTLHFLSLNYSEVGLLLQSSEGAPLNILKIGEELRGVIHLPDTNLKFSGKVTRVKEGTEGHLYALRIQKMNTRLIPS